MLPTSLPIGPPILLTALPARPAALDIAGPADDVTLDRPSEALDCMLLAVSFVFDTAEEAVSLAFSVVEADRKGDLRNRSWRLLCRSSVRDTIDADMVGLNLPATAELMVKGKKRNRR